MDSATDVEAGRAPSAPSSGATRSPPKDPDRPSRVPLRVLLVYPEIPTTYWNMRHALPFIGKKATLPPLGLLTVGALLPADCEVELVDMNVEPLTAEAVAAADLVFTSSMLVQKRSHEEVVRRCRALGKPIVAGGPYPTSSYEEIEGVDYFVLGEAEDVLPRFVEDYRRGGAARVYRAAEKPDVRTSPIPRFALLRPGAYASMALQYSRGCPYDCEFCDVIELFGRRPRTKSPAQFLAEMESLYATGYRGSLFVVDDNFIGNKKEVMQLLPRLAVWQRAHGYPFALFTETTVNLAKDEALLDAMVRAGFNSVFLGIETPVAASLREAHKTQNLELDLLASVRRIQQKGLEVMAGFILGFDGDPDDVFDRQLQFIAQAGIPLAMVGLLTVLPGTRLHRRLAAEGRVVDTGDGNNTFDLHLTYRPKMDEHTLVAGYKRVLGELYDPERYFERCLTLLRELSPHATSARPLGRTEMRAFALSLLVQGTSSYRLAYWKYLSRALAAKPRLFAEAVTMAVKGHHFFRMTEELVGAPSPALRSERRAASRPALTHPRLARPPPAGPLASSPRASGPPPAGPRPAGSLVPRSDPVVAPS